MSATSTETIVASPTVADPAGDHEKQQTQDIASSLSNEGPNPNDRPACFRSTAQEIIFVMTATMGVGMPSILAGATIVISSFIGEDLNMSTSEITWITASSS